jgi:hypothetical protein
VVGLYPNLEEFAGLRSLAVAWAYCIFFGYTKWAFPTVELEESRDVAKRHRAFWYVISVSILGAALKEILI